MRALSPETAAWAQAEALNRTHVWRITRRDGAQFGFTDHDQAINFGGLVCVPAEGLIAGEIELSDDLSADTASLAGALSSEAITEADLAAGLWDGAKIEVFAVDWRNPSHSVSLFTGSLGEVSHQSGAFQAEVRGLQAALNAPVGRNFGRACDARLGDWRCGVSLAGFTDSGLVQAVSADGRVSVSGVSAPSTDWFVFGEARLANGQKATIAGQRALEGGGLELRFASALAAGLSVGQAITLIAGCDKAVATCRVKFNNLLNFQGFPHMPGNDVLTAGPQAQEPRDGGSRFG
jgi:uncharacterized phage protein (TIGR02218 family)